MTPISPERVEHLVAVADPAQHRRADEDAGDDLADDGGDADPLGHLGRHLGGDQHDEDVAQDLGDVHVRPLRGWVGTRTGRARWDRARPVSS